MLAFGQREDVPAHGRGGGTRWSLRSLPTQTILWFCDSMTCTCRLLFRCWKQVLRTSAAWAKNSFLTQIFSEAQGEKEVFEELCSSWICLPRTDMLGWAGLALHSSGLKALIAGAHPLCLLLQRCSVKLEPWNKACPTASPPHRSASVWGLNSSGVFFMIRWSVFR